MLGKLYLHLHVFLMTQVGELLRKPFMCDVGAGTVAEAEVVKVSALANTVQITASIDDVILKIPDLNQGAITIINSSLIL